MDRFNGVGTKYISNYIYWFKWLELFENDKEAMRVKNFMVQCNVIYAFIKTAVLRERELLLM